MRWWTLSKQARIEGLEPGEVVARIAAEQKRLKRRFPQRLPSYIEKPFVAGSSAVEGSKPWAGGEVARLPAAGQLDEAKTRLRQMVKRQRHDPFVGAEQRAETLARLAAVAEDLDHRDTAVAAYTEAAALSGSAEAIAALERLGQPVPAATPAVNFVLPVAGGEAVELSGYRGRAMLMAYGGLGGLMPAVLDSLEILQEKYGVEVLCVDGGYGESGTKPQGVGQYGFTFASDDGQVFAAYRPDLLGSVFLIDTRGRMRLRRDLSRRADRPVLVEAKDCFLPIERRLDAWRASGELSG